MGFLTVNRYTDKDVNDFPKKVIFWDFLQPNIGHHVKRSWQEYLMGKQTEHKF